MSGSPGSAYVTSVGAFLPGEPVDNDQMEARLGLVNGKPSRYRPRILAANGIQQRHYALDANGVQTHLNQDLCALAVQDALARRGMELSQVGMLAVGTTIPDVLMPGFASMVHGRLGGPPMEILSAAGICAAGAAAFKAAWLNVALGAHDVAVAAGSELASAMMHARRFTGESQLADQRAGAASSFRYFNADLLRWMLSDGAGAVVIERRPAPRGLSLRIDWAELTSYAGEFPTCMYLGTSNPGAPAVGNTWLTVDRAAHAEQQGMMVVRQDTDLLAKVLVDVGKREVRRLLDKGRLDARATVHHFLPHLSSQVFADAIERGFSDVGYALPREKWFTNLSTRGNTGSASFYILLEEALRTGRFQPGDRVLALVPESGRFTMSFIHLTCVSAG